MDEQQSEQYHRSLEATLEDFLRLLEKDPSQRFGSAKEVSELLEGCLAHVQQPATAPLPEICRERPPLRRWWPVGVLVVLAIALLVLFCLISTASLLAMEAYTVIDAEAAKAAKILVLSMQDDPSYVRQAFSAGMTWKRTVKRRAKKAAQTGKGRGRKLAAALLHQMVPMVGPSM